MALLAAVVLMASSAAGTESTGVAVAQSLTMVFSPSWRNAEMIGLDVQYRFKPIAPAQALELDWPTLLPELGRSTDQLTNLQVADEHGALPLQRGPAKPGLDTYVSERAPVGEVTVSYRVPVAVPRPAHRGPHKELQAVAGGLESSGAGVLLLPPASSYVLDARWQLPADVRAEGSFGGRAFTATLSREDLLAGFFLVGRMQTYPAQHSEAGLAIYMLGQSRITTPAFLDWTAQVYQAERRAFHGSSTRRFPIFEVSYDGGVPDSGTADAHGDFMYIPKDDPAPDWQLRILTAHEMVHVWQPAFNDADSTDWFIEGSANYLESALPYQAGLISREDFLNDINEHARDYYTNPLRTIPNAAIAAAKWTSPTSWSVPYNRGFFYLANLDAQVRRASHGRLSLVDLMLRYQARRKAGVADISVWRSVVQEAVGQTAVQAFGQMLAGVTITPDPAAFGPSVQAAPTRYSVVTADYRLRSDGHTVAAVQPASAAAKAGLQAGDVLAGPAPKPADVGKPFDLAVLRGGQTLRIRYVPSGEQLAGYAWKASLM